MAGVAMDGGMDIVDDVIRIIAEVESVQISIGASANFELVCKLGLIPKFFKHHLSWVLMPWRTSAIDGSGEVALPDCGGSDIPPMFLHDTSRNETPCEEHH